MKSKILTLVVMGIALNSCNTTREAPVQNYKQTGDVQPVTVSAPFSKGVNFSAWFESYSAQSIPFTKYREQDFADVKSLGADVIRLPIRMHSMTGGAPNYTIDPLLFRFLDMAVDWAEKYELYLIIDNHSFDPVKKTANDIDKILLPVWAQVANRYKDRSDYIVYEILNEPHGISDARWGEVQGMAIDTIRRYDKKHAIIVGGTDYNSIGKLSSIPKYSDPNLIYTFHFYDPHLFTHQGANWGEPSMASLAEVPFPAGVRRMPKFPADLRNTWLEDAFYYYHEDGRPEKLFRTLDRVVAFSKERNVPVFCGEFGVFMINSLQDDRVRWYEVVADALDRRNISRTSWDYYGGFGIFKGDRGSFKHDLNLEVVAALGFKAPAQTPKTTEPFSDGFVLFDDYPNSDFSVWSWGEDTDFSLYDTNASRGDYAIRWGDASQYNIFFFGFEGAGDFSALVSGYSLEFRARTEKPVRFDVRFVNPETQTLIPWRIRYTIDERILPPDGKWHTIRIQLSDMNEHGAWLVAKSQWIPPRGDFTWKNVKQLEFVAEHGDMKGQTVYFDDIKIVKN
jgi:endoglucanase